jgi:hypothetical protein
MGRLYRSPSNSATSALVSQGVTPVFEGPAEITARMAREIDMFSALGKRANISME